MNVELKPHIWHYSLQIMNTNAIDWASGAPDLDRTITHDEASKVVSIKSLQIGFAWVVLCQLLYMFCFVANAGVTSFAPESGTAYC